MSLATLLDDLELLELLETPTDHLATSGVVMGSARADLLLASVDVGEKSDSSPGSDVDLAGERSHSNVEPVVVIGGQFLG